MRSICLVVAIAVFVSGCASTYSLKAEAIGKQAVRFDGGRPELVSETSSAAIRVSPRATSFQNRMSIAVVIFNKADHPVNFGYENIKVNTGSGIPIRLFTYDQLRKEARDAATWAAVATALSAGAQSYAASQPSTINTYGSSYGSAGFSTYSARTTIYNPAAAAAGNAIAQQNARQDMQNISQALEGTLNRLDGSILRTTTVDPRTAFGGEIVVDKPKFSKGEVPYVIITVDVEGEEHEFKFSIASEG